MCEYLRPARCQGSLRFRGRLRRLRRAAIKRRPRFYTTLITGRSARLSGWHAMTPTRRRADDIAEHRSNTCLRDSAGDFRLISARYRLMPPGLALRKDADDSPLRSFQVGTIPPRLPTTKSPRRFIVLFAELRPGRDRKFASACDISGESGARDASRRRGRRRRNYTFLHHAAGDDGADDHLGAALP